MSIATMLQAHDDGALEALASKGLCRRARKEAGGQNWQIKDLDIQQAVVISENETITITEKGPLQADCSCAAVGVCRHILTAVMVLRDHSVPQVEVQTSLTSKTDGKDTVLKQLVDMDNAELIKFAGADLGAAISLTGSIEKPEITENGLNLSITLPDNPVNVTFIAGQSLKDAVYKGPTTKRRLIVAACALMVRAREGILFDVETVGVTPASNASFSETELQEIALCIAQAVRSVLSGIPAIGADQLFDKAISARVQSAPRLTAQLRALAKQAVLASSRHIDFEPAGFLEAAANCYALCEAIRLNPEDVNLTGSLRREYKKADPLTVWVLGARAWRTPSGARGLTSYCFDVDRNHWFETTTARAAGMDLSFSAELAYTGTLWKAGTPSSMMGHHVILPTPLISKDAQISQTTDQAASVLPGRLNIKSLENSGGIVENWRAAQTDISERLGLGMSRNNTPVALLIKPSRHLEISFDEMSQCYKWGVVDNEGAVLNLEIDAEHGQLAQLLQKLYKKIYAVLVVCMVDGFNVKYLPVSIFQTHRSELSVLNIQLDQIEHRKLFGRVKPKFSSIFPKFRAPDSAINSPLTTLLDKVLDGLVDVSVSPARVDRLAGLSQECEKGGLLALANALDRVRDDNKIDSVLKCTYALNEIRQIAHFS